MSDDSAKKNAADYARQWLAQNAYKVVHEKDGHTFVGQFDPSLAYPGP